MDLAVVSTAGRAPLESYELHHLLDEPLYVAVPVGHPLAGHEGPVPPGRFADADRISGGPRPEGTHLDAAVRQGFSPRVAHVVGEWTAKQGYVAAGLGITLVPALAAASVRPDLALLGVLDEGAPARAAYAATLRGRSLTPAASAFLDAVREATAKIPA
ncbi:LysR substrate-binding domain-containing protein [Streptomyces sp. NPDC006265]|uniref:LysR substrate-binding domain-containing protein n=1 Tax=Streptomyces sp. NPDC006265 TaxID=3156740 RepID=UPI0033AD247A